MDQYLLLIQPLWHPHCDLNRGFLRKAQSPMVDDVAILPPYEQHREQNKGRGIGRRVASDQELDACLFAAWLWVLKHCMDAVDWHPAKLLKEAGSRCFSCDGFQASDANRLKVVERDDGRRGGHKLLGHCISCTLQLLQKPAIPIVLPTPPLDALAELDRPHCR